LRSLLTVLLAVKDDPWRRKTFAVVSRSCACPPPSPGRSSPQSVCLPTFLGTLQCRSRGSNNVYSGALSGVVERATANRRHVLPDRLRPVPRPAGRVVADATYRVVVSRRIARPLASSHPAKWRAELALERGDGPAPAPGHHPSSSQPLVATSCVQHSVPSLDRSAAKSLY